MSKSGRIEGIENETTPTPGVIPAISTGEAVFLTLCLVVPVLVVAVKYLTLVFAGP